MKTKKFARFFAVLSIICALGFGLYINFSETGNKTQVNKAIMVCLFK